MDERCRDTTDAEKSTERTVPVQPVVICSLASVGNSARPKVCKLRGDQDDVILYIEVTCESLSHPRALTAHSNVAYTSRIISHFGPFDDEGYQIWT